MKSREDNKPFVSVIGDFNAEGMTVFGRKAMTHWKPVLLISRQIIRLFAYLVMYRDEAGNWIIYLRSYASDEALAKMQVTVTVRKPTIFTNSKANSDTKINIDGSNDDEARTNGELLQFKEDSTFSFTARILNQDVSEQEVIDSGNYLCLKDSQVRKFCIDRTLFEYSVEVGERE